MRYTDPTGHYIPCEPGDGCTQNVYPSLPSDNNDSPINDPNWDDKDIVERTRLVWDALCQAGGWWGSGCPTEQQLVTWLLFEEGGPNLPSDYEKNMARGMRYRFAYYGTTEEAFIVQLSAFTAFYNPDSDGDFDQDDWDLLTNPPYLIKPPIDLDRSASIVGEIYESEIKSTDGNYMYWWDGDEVKTDRSKWPGKKDVNYFETRTVTGLPFYFTGIPNIQYCAMRAVNCE